MAVAFGWRQLGRGGHRGRRKREARWPLAAATQGFPPPSLGRGVSQLG